MYFILLLKNLVNIRIKYIHKRYSNKPIFYYTFYLHNIVNTLYYFLSDFKNLGWKSNLLSAFEGFYFFTKRRLSFNLILNSNEGYQEGYSKVYEQCKDMNRNLILREIAFYELFW